MNPCACGCGTLVRKTFERGHHWKTRGPDDYFWPRVQKSDGCWVWTGPRTGSGYGAVMIGRRNVSVHRLSWTLANGPIPDGMDVCHTCDNPPCVRPDHLFLGTSSDNTHDMIAKGRQRMKPPTPLRGQAWRDAHMASVPRGANHPVRLHPELIRRGERHHNVRFTDADVGEMRRLRIEGLTLAAIGTRFGAGPSVVHNIVSGHSRTQS